VANPISLVRLDELSSYIAQFTTKLRMTDVESEKVKLAAEEHINELKGKYSTKVRKSFIIAPPIKKTIKRDSDEPQEPEVDPAQLATLLSFPQMIESANFPVINESTLLTLPNKVSAINMLTEALKSRKLSQGVVKNWTRKLSSSHSIDLFTSSYWYHLRMFWEKITEFSPQLNMRKSPQETDPVKIESYKTQLLTIASTSYVKLFLEIKGADKDGILLI
jgi:hypothetical protein